MDIWNWLVNQFSYTLSHNTGVGMMFLLLIGMSILLFYLAIFYFLFTHTKNPLLKSIFWLFLESLLKLIPEPEKAKKKK